MIRKILVVDDEPAAVSEMAHFLEHQGLSVHGTSDPQAALIAIAGDKTLYAVVTDLRMPRIDGFRVLKAASQHRAAGRITSIVAITGHATEGDEQRAYACGAMHFFQKPINLRQLLEALAP